VPIQVTLGGWDIVLIVMVACQATVLAYLRDPRWKAFVFSLPIPFTFAFLAVGRPVDLTNVLGMTLLLAFTHGVRLLHVALRLPILLSIAVATGAYCVLSALVAPLVPADNEALFCGSALATVLFGWVVYHLTPPRVEQGHRSPLPIWLKLPLVGLVVLGLMLMKNALRGFTTVFPMMGVITAYEARASLWTICRQVPAVMIALTSMMMTVRLLQPSMGIGPALAVGWLAHLLIIGLFMRDALRATPAERLGGQAGEPAGDAR
jgi:hypothetical protein